MKIHVAQSKKMGRRGGWALLVTLTLTACAAMVLAGVLNWTNTSSWIVARNNEYYATSTPRRRRRKRSSWMIQDYDNSGWSYVASRMSTYSNAVPNSSDCAYWNNYSFSAGPGQMNQTVVNLVNQSNVVYLQAPYEGLMLLAAE